VLAAGALVLGVLAMTVSTLLNFGPRHAMAWLTLRPMWPAGAALVALALVPCRSAWCRAWR
jgi:hypothetical protein